MKCPYCGKAMEVGYIHNGRNPVQWIPAGKKPPLLAFSSDYVECKNEFSMAGYRAEAFYCSTCRILLAKTEG